jgi:hypothetical protein
MNANLVGALAQINKSWRTFEHKGMPMKKKHVIACLEYGIKKGYKHTGQLTDAEIDEIIFNETIKNNKTLL